MKKQNQVFIFNIIFLVGLLVGFLFVTAPLYLIKIRYQQNLRLDTVASKKQLTSLRELYDESVDFSRINFNPPNILTPFVGTAPLPGVHGNASINQQQFRYQEQISHKKKQGEFRIFLTGGSTAYGSGASAQEKTISGYLESMLNSSGKNTLFRVVNAANTGWNSTHERIWIENTLTELDPDIVISLTGTNDVHYGIRGLSVLQATTTHENYFYNILKIIHRSVFLSDFPRMNQPENSRISCDRVGESFVKNIVLSGFALNRAQAEYFVFLQPVMPVTQKLFSSREKEILSRREKEISYFQDCYQLIEQEIVREKSSYFQYKNLASIFDSADTQKEFFLDSYHFADQGNLLIAEQIRDFLVKNSTLLHIEDSSLNE